MTNYLLYDPKWDSIISFARCKSFDAAVEVFQLSCEAWINSYEVDEDRKRARENSIDYVVLELGFKMDACNNLEIDIKKERFLYGDSEKSNE